MKNYEFIIDIVKDGQTGISLRTLEAIYLNKKIITNNKYIRKYDFFNENIFVLNENKSIEEFIKSDYKPINNSIKDKYEFNEWIKRFD